MKRPMFGTRYGSIFFFALKIWRYTDFTQVVVFVAVAVVEKQC